MSIKNNDYVVSEQVAARAADIANISSLDDNFFDDNFQLTKEAVKHLKSRRKELEALVYAEAVNEALTTRGEPIEVTASDVAIATDMVLKSTVIKSLIVDEIHANNLNIRHLSSKRRVDKLIKAYKHLGLAMLLGVITAILIARPDINSGSAIAIYVILILGSVAIVLPDILSFFFRAARRFIKGGVLHSSFNDFYNLITRS